MSNVGDHRGSRAGAPTVDVGNGAVTAEHQREDVTRDQSEVQSAAAYRCREAQESAQKVRQRAVAIDDATADLRRIMAGGADVLASTEILDRITRFADSRAAERYGTVMGVALRAVLAIPPQVVLPPIIGGEVSLNLLLALVGTSGGGKGSADKSAAAAVRMSIGGHRPFVPPPMLPIGTGEGINRTFAVAERDKQGSGQVGLRWHTDHALFGCRDIAALDAITARRGATLVPELLKAYMGEELGFANAEKERRVMLPMHSYRLCLSAGVQPDNGAVLLNDQARRDGVPQRFLWAPVRPGVARSRRRADDAAVEAVDVTVPSFGIDPFRIAIGGDDDGGPLDFDASARPLVLIDVESSIAQQIIDADAAKDLDPFGRSADPLAGHRLLAQLKLAAAFAVLHNRTVVGSGDWQRAERFMAVSTAVADVVAAESQSAAEQDAVRRGQIDGQRLAASDDARSAATLQTVIQRITRYLAEQTDWVSQGAVRRSVTAKLRPYFDDAMLALFADGTIEARKTKRGGQDIVVHRLATK